jgi:hypothetical protein
MKFEYPWQRTGISTSKGINHKATFGPQKIRRAYDARSDVNCASCGLPVRSSCHRQWLRATCNKSHPSKTDDSIWTVHLAIPDNKYLASAYLQNQTRRIPCRVLLCHTQPTPARLDLELMNASTKFQPPTDRKLSSRHDRNSIRSRYGER